jgi:hypothetical protein
MSKRVKISFKEIMKGKYTFIPQEEICASNQRIKLEMKEIIKKLKQKKEISV